MSGAPRLSFLVAVRDRPRQVVEAIASVPAREDLEVVVVDDASTDGTAGAVEACGHPRVRLLSHPERRGAGAARNTAARAARGQWCFILDSDNALLPDGLAGIDAAIAAAGAAADVMFLGSVLASGAPTGTKVLPDGPIDARDLLRGRVRGEYCVLVRRSALLEVPYNETPGRDNALATWLRIARRGGFAAFDRPVLRYDDRGADRLSSRERALEDPEEAAWCHHQLLELFGAELRELDPLAWADRVARAAFLDVVAGRRRRAARELLRAATVSPQRSTALALAAVITGPRIARAIYARTA